MTINPASYRVKPVRSLQVPEYFLKIFIGISVAAAKVVFEYSIKQTRSNQEQLLSKYACVAPPSENASANDSYNIVFDF